MFQKRAESWLTGIALTFAGLSVLLYLLSDSSLYYARVVYFKIGLLFPVITGLLFIILLVKVFLKPPERKRTAAFALILTFIAVLVAAAAMLPQFLVDFEHLDSAELDNHRYHAGLSMAIDGDNYIWLYQCDSSGLICERQNEFSCAFPSGMDASAVTLQADPVSKTLHLLNDGTERCTFINAGAEVKDAP